MMEEQKLLAEVLDLFARRFDKKAVLRGGMVLRILGCERLTNDLDYVFVPYRSKKDIVKEILDALRSLDNVKLRHYLNSKCLRVIITREQTSIQVEAKVAMHVDTETLSTCILAKEFGLPARLIPVLNYSVALADKMAAWNEHRLMRDLYDIWFFLRMGILPDTVTLRSRLKKPVYSRLVSNAQHYKGKTIEEFYAFLRDHTKNLTDEIIAQELSDYLRPEELAGLAMMIRAELAKPILDGL